MSSTLVWMSIAIVRSRPVRLLARLVAASDRGQLALELLELQLQLTQRP
jgi:hypothetical protein